MPSSPFIASGNGDVQGDDDIEDFDWNVDMDNDELLALYERNGTMGLLCDWIPGEALKNGWVWKQKGNVEFYNKDLGQFVQNDYDNFLETISFKPKVLRAIAFARLHGSALMVFFNDTDNLRSAEKPFYDCEVYHKYCSGNGWVVSDVDPFGNPTEFMISIKTEGMDRPFEYPVSADRCIVFKNPMKGQRWDGTPSSIMVAHYCQAEELTVKNTIKWVMLHAKATAVFKNITTQDQATKLHTVFNHGQADELMFNQFDLDWKAPPLQSLGQSIGTFFNILSNLQARTLRVSRQAMDGAPEGTLSSAQYNYVLTYAGVEQVQEHFKPFIEKCFVMFGFKNPNIDFPKLQLGDNAVAKIDSVPSTEKTQSQVTTNVNSPRDIQAKRADKSTG